MNGSIRPGHAVPPRRRALLPLLVLLAATGCGTQAEGPPPSRTSSYAGGPPPTLPGVPAAWRHVPGIVAADEALFLDGGWVVLDGLEGRLHLLDSLGGPLGVVGRRGDGPGELSAPRHLAREGTGFVVVGAGGRLDRFSAAGRFLERRQVVLDGCPFPEIREAREVDRRLHLAVACLRDRRRHFALHRVEPDGRASALVDVPAAEGDDFTLHGPALASSEEGPVWGTGDDPCLQLLREPGLPPADAGCLHGPAIPLSDPLRREMEASLGERARAAGIRLVIPEHLPWFDRLVEGAGSDILAVRPVSARGWRLERVGPEAGRWAVPTGVEVHGSHGRILLVHHGMEGVALASFRAADLPLERHTGASPAPATGAARGAVR